MAADNPESEPTFLLTGSVLELVDPQQNCLYRWAVQLNEFPVFHVETQVLRVTTGKKQVLSAEESIRVTKQLQTSMRKAGLVLRSELLE